MNSTDDIANSPSDPIEAQIMARMRRAGRGSVWCAERCGGAFPRNAVDQALARMTKRHILVRIAHGVYLYPILDPILGHVPAVLADVHDMLAAIGVGPLIATGATVAAQYGLCGGDTARHTYGGVGVSRTIETPWWTIEIRPIAARYIVGLHPQTAMVIQALRFIGNGHWQAAHSEVLRLRLSGTGCHIVAAEAPHAPGWMRPILGALV